MLLKGQTNIQKKQRKRRTKFRIGIGRGKGKEPGTPPNLTVKEEDGRLVSQNMSSGETDTRGGRENEEKRNSRVGTVQATATGKGRGIARSGKKENVRRQGRDFEKLDVCGWGGRSSGGE